MGTDGQVAQVRRNAVFTHVLSCAKALRVAD